MEERFVSFLFRRITEKLDDITSAGSNEEVDTYAHELGGYVDELREVVKHITGFGG